MPIRSGGHFRNVPRVDIGPLLMRSFEGSVSAMARAVGVPDRTVYRWREHGLPLDEADEVAIRCDAHPGELWPEEWWAQEGDLYEAPTLFDFEEW